VLCELDAPGLRDRDDMSDGVVATEYAARLGVKPINDGWIVIYLPTEKLV